MKFCFFGSFPSSICRLFTFHSLHKHFIIYFWPLSFSRPSTTCFRSYHWARISCHTVAIWGKRRKKQRRNAFWNFKSEHQQQKAIQTHTHTHTHEYIRIRRMCSSYEHVCVYEQCNGLWTHMSEIIYKLVLLYTCAAICTLTFICVCVLKWQTLFPSIPLASARSYSILSLFSSPTQMRVHILLLNFLFLLFFEFSISLYQPSRHAGRQCGMPILSLYERCKMNGESRPMLGWIEWL